MNKTEKVIKMIFIANDNSPIVLYPGEKSFNFPASFIAPEFSSVLRLRFLSIPFMRRNQLNSERCHFLIQWVGIISFIADQFFRLFSYQSLFKRFPDKSDFMRRSRVCVNGERKTSAICHCHELRTFAPLGLSNSKPPFLAETNVPSIKHSERSSLPLVCKSSAKALNTFLSVPSLTQVWKRRWQVW